MPCDVFTGLIQDIGILRAWKRKKGSMSLEIEHCLPIDINVGDSVSVDGCCLTVENLPSGQNPKSKRFSASAVYETIKRTNLSELRVGSFVNLEPALRVGDRMGGHIVQGHIDTVGRILRRYRRGDSLIYQVRFPAEYSSVVVSEGSIAIDGISLTVKNANASQFEVAVIPETIKRTKLVKKTAGNTVNLEFDIIGKYVNKGTRI